ncbi:DUF397 domain-containing protein [Streptomyces sp. NPDC018955]|uniref:DUF397 domain-containing protein n=1 Tax=Streptomyces sp. NPDC018955 TaxID=3365055 RepID=UPI0037AED620
MSTDRAKSSSEHLTWIKSSYSGSGGGDCVEVATSPSVVYVRDSKAVGGGPVLRVGRDGWAAFVARAAG